MLNLNEATVKAAAHAMLLAGIDRTDCPSSKGQGISAEAYRKGVRDAVCMGFAFLFNGLCKDRQLAACEAGDIFVDVILEAAFVGNRPPGEEIERVAAGLAAAAVTPSSAGDLHASQLYQAIEGVATLSEQTSAGGEAHDPLPVGVLHRQSVMGVAPVKLTE